MFKNEKTYVTLSWSQKVSSIVWMDPEIEITTPSVSLVLKSDKIVILSSLKVNRGFLLCLELIFNVKKLTLSSKSFIFKVIRSVVDYFAFTGINSLTNHLKLNFGPCWSFFLSNWCSELFFYDPGVLNPNWKHKEMILNLSMLMKTLCIENNMQNDLIFR